jgi:hypothetical protein
MNGGKHHELQPENNKLCLFVSASKEHAFMECSLISGLHAIVCTFIYICYEV